MVIEMDREKFLQLLPNLSDADILLVHDAYWISKNAHRFQKRDGGGRYFEHPRSVAQTLIEHGHTDKDTVILALLHDIVEDTFVPIHLLQASFGSKIFESIMLLSRKIPSVDRRSGEIFVWVDKSIEQYYADLLNAPLSVRLVKCADRLCNLRDMKNGWNLPKQAQYAYLTMTHVYPLAAKTDEVLFKAIRELVVGVIEKE